MKISNELLKDLIAAKLPSDVDNRVAVYDKTAKSIYAELLESRAKLNRLAALEAVCREIIENCPQHAVITDPANIQVAYSIAQKLKAVLEEV